MQKNVAGQKWVVFAFNRTNNVPQTGDAANITANLQRDFGAVAATNDTNPTEREDGFYTFDLTQAETNGDQQVIYPASSTADIQVIGVPGSVFTTPAGFPDDIVQTGDNYVRLGPPAGSSLAADVANVPTVAELNARTLASASYFDPATDTVATVNTLTNKTGFSLSTAGILAIWHQIVSAVVTASTMGKLVVDFLNASVSSRMAETSISTTGGVVDNVTSVANVTGGATAAAQSVAQNDLNIVTGADGATLATLQGNYAPAKAGDNMGTVSSVVGNVGGSVGSLGVTAKADVNTEVDAALDTAIPVSPTADSINQRLAAVDDLTQAGGSGDLIAIKAGLGVKKNAVFDNYTFLMVLNSDHVTPVTGLTVTGQRSLDNGGFVAVSGTITEVGAGYYRFDALAADTNGDFCTWKFSSATADDAGTTFLTIA